MSNNVEKAEKALKSALAHAGVSHIQDNRVFNAIDKLVEAKVEARTEAFQAALAEKDAHLKRETDLVSKAIGGGSEVFMRLGDDFVLDPTYVADYICNRRQEYSENKLQNIKQVQALEKTIKMEAVKYRKDSDVRGILCFIGLAGMLLSGRGAFGSDHIFTISTLLCGPAVFETLKNIFKATPNYKEPSSDR